MTDRILLTQVAGEWRLPCGCALHYFDGVPATINVLADERSILTGKVAPHIHVRDGCDRHGARRSGSAG